MVSDFALAAACLFGTIVGAGIFAIPYVMAMAGVLTSVFYFLLLGGVVLLLHLLLGEVVLRTKGEHRLVGYAEKYLGRRAKAVVAVSTIIGTIGALLAYIILSGRFLNVIFPILAASHWTLISWALLSLLVLFGIKTIASAELLMNLGLCGVVVFIFGFSFPHIRAFNFSLINPEHLFLPFGIFLFSLVGWNAVPEIAKILKKKKQLKTVIIFTTLAVVCFYFLFGLIISGVTGKNTTEEPFAGLQNFLGHKIAVLGSIFGVLAVGTSYLILGSYLKNTLLLDYRFPLHSAFSLACFSPLILFLLGFQNFIWVISIVGSFIGLMEGASIALLFKKAKKKGDKRPAYCLKVSNISLYIIIAVLLLGAVVQVIYH